MVKLLRLYPDMTFEEKRAKTSQDKITVDKDVTVDFEMGTSIFKERRKPIDYFKPWKRSRQLAILLDGTPTALSLRPLPDDKLSLAFDFGTIKDTVKFIYKIVAKSKSDQKPISNTQFMVLALLIGAVVVFQMMMLKGVKF